MLKEILLEIYERDIEKLKREINLYSDEEKMWVVRGEVTNSAGNLTLHLIGNLNHFFGTVLNKTGFVRDRESEFINQNISRQDLNQEIDKAKAVVRNALDNLSVDELAADYPLEFNGQIVKTDFMLVHLLTHLSYHLGQINYHRRLVG